MDSENASGHNLEVRNLVKWFGDDRAVDNLSISLAEGKFLTLLGPSGCGKTTTLMSIAGLHSIDSGRIRVGDVVYTSPKEGIFLPPEKRDIGMVFQSYAIWPHMTVTPARSSGGGTRTRAISASSCFRGIVGSPDALSSWLMRE